MQPWMGSPRAWDLTLAATSTGALVIDGLLSASQGTISAAAYPLAVAVGAPLAWRRRAPVPVLLASGGALLACLPVFAPYHAAIPVAMVPLYTVAVLGDRRRSLIVGAIAALAFAAAISGLEATGSLSEGSTRVLLALIALIVGDAVRTRRELRAAAAERSERLEEEREQDNRRRVADERLRIARELHDTLAHALVAINVRAGVSAYLGQDGTAALTEIKDVSAEALGDLRSTLDLLRQPADAAPTKPALDLRALPQLVDGVRAGGLEVDTDVQLGGAAVPSAVGQVGYRIVQESLTNVLRHAQAARAQVGVHVIDHVLEIDVADDGSGGHPGSDGHGLRGMAERAAALGGRVDAGPRRGGGWRVLARLPLAAPECDR